ncbi:Kinase [Spironucleus salmonicida]|uniref:Kinase n=1 Tax=Spironucleus salmonicida TaxID=348837 RepID=V6LCH9_9EUKA|nr:Kinase [Spironucleus salmonicida]|eukprot:EST42180.1 Kinase [Spironucleus salmonicida]
MTYRVILGQGTTVMASAEIDMQFHYITQTTYEVFNIPMTQRLSQTQLAFIPSYEPPKKPLNPKVRSINNTLHLGAITTAKFINQVLYIATSKGNIMEVDPRTQFILDVTKMTDESIRDFLISDHGNLTVCTANSVLVLTDQKDIIDVPITEPLRLYPSSKVPIQDNQDQLPFSQICLVQTATHIGQLDVVEGQLTLKGLFENTFYDAVDLPQLGFIIAINAHKRLSAYGYNGKCYGKCDLAFKPRKMIFLQSGAILIYTYCDRLVQVFMRVQENGKKCVFVPNSLSTPRIQSCISTSCPQEVHEYLEQVFEQQRPDANLFLGNSFICVARAHSAAVVDFAAYFVQVSENEGLKDLVPKQNQQENAYQYYMQQYKNADISIQHEALQLAVKITKDKYQPHTELINQCKNKLNQTLKLYEEVYPDIIPDSALQSDKFQQIIDETLAYMQDMENDSCNYVIKEFPKEIKKPEDVNIRAFNLSVDVLSKYVEKYDENDYMDARKQQLEVIYAQLQDKSSKFIEQSTKYIQYQVPIEAVQEEVVVEEETQNQSTKKKLAARPVKPIVDEEPKLLTYITEKVDEKTQEFVNSYADACWDIIQQTRAANLKARLYTINEGLKQFFPKLDQFDFHFNKTVESIFRMDATVILQKQLTQEIQQNQRQKTQNEIDKLRKQSDEEQNQNIQFKSETSELIDPSVADSMISENKSLVPKFSKVDPLKIPKMALKQQEKELDIEEDVKDNEDSFEKAILDVETENKDIVHKKRISRKVRQQIKENEGKFIDMFNINSDTDPVISEQQFIHIVRSAMLARQAVYSTTVRQKHLQVFDTAIDDANSLIHLYLPECAVVEKRFVLLPTDKIAKSSWESLLLAYDLRLHQFCSAKQLPSNLSGRQFIRNFRAINHQGLLSYLGYGFSSFNSFYIFTQAAPEFTLLDVLQNKVKPFKTEEDVKKFIYKLLQTVDFLNSGEIKLLHRDLRPSQIWLDMSGEEPCPKIYHIGFMQTVLAKEQAELDMFFAAPEVMCGGVTPQSDVWSIGTLAFKLLEQLVGVKAQLFQQGTFSDDQPRDIPQGYNAQLMNNAWVLAQMIEHAKDVQEISKNRIIVVKDNFKDILLKEVKISGENQKSFMPAFGILPWDAETKGVPREPKNNALAKLYKKVDGDALDFIQKCWCIQPSKRDVSRVKLQHKWFASLNTEIAKK